MANVETIYDSVIVYPGAWPPTIRAMIEEYIELNPSATGEDAVNATVFRIAGELATQDQRPETILA